MSDCLFELRGGKWVCVKCHQPTRFGGDVPPLRNCRISIVEDLEMCPFHQLVIHLSTSGVDRLQECRRISCDQLRTNSGVTLCGRLTGTQCKTLGRFVEFLNGNDMCPFWRTENE